MHSGIDRRLERIYRPDHTPFDRNAPPPPPPPAPAPAIAPAPNERSRASAHAYAKARTVRRKHCGTQFLCSS